MENYFILRANYFRAVLWALMGAVIGFYSIYELVRMGGKGTLSVSSSDFWIFSILLVLSIFILVFSLLGIFRKKLIVTESEIIIQYAIRKRVIKMSDIIGIEPMHVMIKKAAGSRQRAYKIVTKEGTIVITNEDFKDIDKFQELIR